MPGDPSRPPKPSWRDPVKPSDRRPEAQKAWRKEPVAATASRRRWSKKTLFGVSFIGLLVCAALIVKLILMLIPAKGACLVLIGAGYEDNLAIPHNAYGMKALKDLAPLANPEELPPWSWSESGDLRRQHDPQTPALAKDWFKDWGNFRQKAVVIYLALHGGTDANGPYLLLDDPTGHERLYLSQVLTDLAKLSDKMIFLILDATQAVDNPSLGMLDNDFARQLEELKPEIAKVPNLVIMSASGAGEHSWASEELQQTVFAHFVIEGLKGGACKQGIGAVSAQNLFDFVSKEVEKWVLINRAAVQKPVLIDPNKKAAAIELVGIKEPYSPPAPTDVESSTTRREAVPVGLAAIWQEYQKLAEETLPPAVHSPHRWRQYGETVLRYEQLLRAGDPTGKAELVRKKIDGLNGEMRQAANDLRMNLSSMNNALPLARTLGWPDPDVRDQFAELWNAKEDKRNEVWARMSNAALKEKVLDSLKVQFGRLLLEKAAENPQEFVPRARELARTLYDGSRSRPAELHYLMLLGRDVLASDPKAEEPKSGGKPKVEAFAPPRPDQELLKAALRLRGQAEQAALADQQRGALRPYSEYVYSWIKKDVSDGDLQRCFGQDLLLSTNKADWDSAKSSFSSAEARYRQAQVDAKAMREALMVRDQALAELPAFSRWLGRREATVETDLDALEKLWADVHELADALDPPSIEGPGTQRRTKLMALTAAVAKGLDDARVKYQEACKRGETLTGRLPVNWRELEELLCVPGLPSGPDGAEVRLKLVANSHAISAGLSLELQKPGATTPTPLPVVPAHQLATRQGRLSLAALGETWVNRLAADHYKSVQPFKTLRARIVDPDSEWHSRLNNAGEQIGDCWQAFPAKVQAHVRDGRDGGVDKAQTELHQADRWARVMDAAGAALLPNNPPDEYRRLRLAGLLLWLAERTVAEYSWSEKDSDEVYYLVAGRAFLKDAAAVAVGGTNVEFTDKQRENRTKTDLAKQLQAELAQAHPLIVPKPAEVYWTDRILENLEFRLQAPDAMAPGLPGIPVVRLQLDPRLKLASAGSEGRMAVERFKDGKPGEFTVNYRVELSDALVTPPNAAFEVLYRGQAISVKAPVNIQRKPDVIVHEYQEPPTGAIAIRVDENAYPGSLTIVLDGSLSMGLTQAQIDKKVVYNRTTPCRYHSATTALKAILARIPNKTRVTVLGFGFKQEKNPQPEMVVEPFLWNANKADQLNDLMDTLEPLRPIGETSPIIDTMVEARKSFTEETGYKTILVLTDGQDNVYNDSESARKKIRDKFEDSGITVNVILFNVSDTEIGNARKQFKVVEELKPEGILDEAKTATELTDKLLYAMRPKVRIKRDGALVEGVPRQGWQTTFLREPDLVPLRNLDPGEYEAVLPGGKRRFFSLKAGERLLVTIRAKGDDVQFERDLYSEYETKRRALPTPPVQIEDWQVAVIQNERKIQLESDPILQLMATVEDFRHPTVPEGGSLQLLKPRFVWPEVLNQADKDAKPLRLEWGNLSGYPATAFTLEARDWNKLPPKPEPKPLLRMWLLSDQEPRSIASPKRNPQQKLPDDFRAPVRVGKQTVHIESVEFERARMVELQPGKKSPVGCLVVRLRHEKGENPNDNLVFIVPHGLKSKPRGAEHYFYNDASRYTAVFWGVTEEQLDDAAFFLGVISLDEIKQARMPVEIKLPPPTQGGSRPDPPL